ncbi:hypothetical protein [Pararhizobium haloflavum]|uniref:hypothetical protein n=1 Tax=Pararhizobium haloflavum TaxID=2037914 RepID=UPI000C19A18C|nr:hypothetical protein [Pararhizobium haloflavum]
MASGSPIIKAARNLAKEISTILENQDATSVEIALILVNAAYLVGKGETRGDAYINLHCLNSDIADEIDGLMADRLRGDVE